MKISVELDLPEADVKVLQTEAEERGITIGQVLSEVVDALNAYEDKGLAEVIQRMKEF